ncbi:MAG: X-Pro dipeptidyl-peptidase, partial [Gemmatimonadota bacterium]|nr:X-Pro dipeptidyl-peptidase [Gemmatimonadota bacterium]
MRSVYSSMLVVLFLGASHTPVIAQDPDGEYIRIHYTKREEYIPMRDGKRLFTILYVPNDTSQRYPILLMRTPYGIGPYGE